MMAKKKAKRIRIQLVRSVIGRLPEQRRTVKALGLKKMNSSVEQEMTPVIMGMVNAVSHLVKVEEIK
jgi:large subunit ribosomal protein L30